MKVTSGYSGLQISLHWLVAAGVIFNYIVSDGMGKALHQRLEGQDVTVGIANLHVWVGMAVLVLALTRIVVKLTRGGPPNEPGLQGKAAAAVHGLLYLLMLAVPAAGMAAWFGGAEGAGDPHGFLANVLIALAGLHALAGLYHHYIVKDGILMRMFRPS